MCGQRFDDSRRKRPSIGKAWIGRLGQFQNEGVCPKCYFERLDRGEEVRASDEHCITIVRNAGTSVEAHRIAVALRDSHPKIANLAEIWEKKLEAQELRLRAEQQEQEAQARARALRKERLDTFSYIVLSLIILIPVCAVVGWLIGGFLGMFIHPAGNSQDEAIQLIKSGMSTWSQRGLYFGGAVGFLTSLRPLVKD